MPSLDTLRGAYVRGPDWSRRLVGPLLATVPAAMRYGRTYSAMRQLIRRSERDPQFARDYQTTELRRLLAHAYASCGHYRESFRISFGGSPPDFSAMTVADLRRLPVLDSAFVRSNPGAFLAGDARRVDTLMTSGSTGEPMLVYLDRARSPREIAFVHHIWSRIGYRLHHRRAVLRAIPIRDVDRKPWTYDSALGELLLSPIRLLPAVMDRYLRLIEDYRINFLHGYPSAITILAAHARRQGWRPPASLLGVLPISESLFAYQREIIREAFGGVGVQPFYGLTEKVAFAGEVEGEPDVYEFEPLYGYTELVTGEGEPVTRVGETGRIVSTGFINAAMPLFRYDTNDTGTLVQRPSLENGFRLRVRGIRSRWNQDFLVGRDGELISVTAINIYHPAYPNVRTFRFVQDTPGIATLQLVPAPGTGDDELSSFVRGIQDRLGTGLVLRREILDEIPANARGKRGLIDQRLPNVSTGGARPAPIPTADRATTTSVSPVEAGRADNPLRSILFIGPLSPPGAPFRGGPDAANHRLLEFLAASGISITALRFPAFVERTLPGLAAYARRYFTLPVAASRALRRRNDRPDLVVISCLYCHFVPLEFALALQARALRRPLVLDLRAGSYEHYYRASGPIYRFLCRRILRCSHLVLTQVPRTATFLRGLGADAMYLPNHVAVPGDIAGPSAEATNGDPPGDLRLVYFGALTAQKGVAEMIDICHALIARGLPATLTLIGGAPEGEKRRWTQRIRTHGIEGSVAMIPPLPFAELKAKVAQGHFFVFPTRWVGEGHSNALTEAMASGLVPVGRDWGCNALVIGDAGHVLPSDATPADYADVIEATWRSGAWNALSHKSRERVRQHYASDVVLPALAAAFRRTVADSGGEER